MSLSSPGDETPSPSDRQNASVCDSEGKYDYTKSSEVGTGVEKLYNMFQAEWNSVNGLTKTEMLSSLSQGTKPKSSSNQNHQKLGHDVVSKVTLPKSQSPFAIAVFKAVAPYAHLLLEGKETSGRNKQIWDKIHNDFVTKHPDLNQSGLRRRMQVAWAMKKYNTKRKKGPLNEVDKTIVSAVEQSRTNLPLIPLESTPKKIKKSIQQKELDEVLTEDVALIPEIGDIIYAGTKNNLRRPRGRPRKCDGVTRSGPSATLYISPSSSKPLNLQKLLGIDRSIDVDDTRSVNVDESANL
ncbi:unnamed protein product [Bursaphelenchus okinawaensis]|uniref:Uncharacterized protein n=1 Tax=Bursaphelenchus okinawaensis TaxID=465554 RepID=A0A811KS19_9BILA|nr:unnamed protein product [Bursaphelenchus okinawaensis]CAG9109206.1 unnamed protein product [Bursaphelenchus okinawaensis]